MTDKYSFFAQHPVFMNLTEDELRALCRIAHEYSFDKNAVIAFQRDVADRMVIVRNGRLFSRELDQHGRVRETHTRAYTENEYFGAEWLFSPATFPATVTGSEPGNIFIITHDDFLEFLKSYPEAIEGFEPEVENDGDFTGLPPNAWEEASKLSLVERREKIGPISLMPDEMVEYYARRSIWYLLVRLLFPLLGMIAVPLLILVVLPPGTLESNTLALIGLILPLILFGSITIFRYLDWTNDYFVITNKHISNREFDLRTFRTELNKVPIEQIQSVEVLKPNLTANIFDIGTVRITTGAMVGMLLFDNIDNPIEVRDTLERLQRRVRDFDEALAQTKMRQSVTDHFDLGPGYEIVPDSDVDGEDVGTAVYRFSLWKAITNLFEWREVEGTTITYRKNYLVLIWDLSGPTIVFALLILALIGVPALDLLSFGWTLAGLSLFFGLNLFWFIWMFEDWRNDIFQLTDRYVIDIDRQPFGFGESRKQALLRNIQNINAERPGFWATLFNYGDVHIDTAGMDSDITFEHVPNPSQILSEIFGRLDNVRQDQRRRDGAERREEYALLLDVYKQELEQGRIPRRTPRDEE